MSNQTLAIQASPNPMRLQTGQQTEFFRVTENGLIIIAGTPQEEWLRLTQEAIADFEKTRDDHAAAMFRVGDALAYGEREYGEEYAQAIDATRKSILLSVKTLKNAAWICKNVGPEVRHEMLSFSHHGEVAALSPEEQRELLEKAEDEAWTIAELRKEIKARHPKETTPTSASTKKAIIDLESEDGLLHAGEKILDFFKDETTTPDQWSKERIRQWAPVIGQLVAYFGALEPVAREASNAVAAFLDNPENGPLKNWSDARKAKWSPSLNAIAKAGRRGEMTACGVSKKKDGEAQDPPEA